MLKASTCRSARTKIHEVDVDEFRHDSL
ncbi:hypothetical protein [Mesorhizobium sp.]